MERCAECGYGYHDLPRPAIAPDLRGQALRFVEILDGSGPRNLRAHPRAGVWSALEYCCHTRDVLVVQRQRLGRALSEDRPEFASMRRDERVLEERYNDQDPRAVAAEIAAAADLLARALEDLDEAGWQRTGVYHWPTTEVRTVEWIGRHTVHETVHHLRDIDLLLAEGP